MNLKAMKKKAEAEVAAWTHPEGTKVTVRRDNGSIHEGQTRSMPWVLGNDSAVILVTGISGCYRLDRVTVVSP